MTTKLRGKARNAEWALMYRLYGHGPDRRQKAELVEAASATVGYHFGVARRIDPGLQAEHDAAVVRKPSRVTRQMARPGPNSPPRSEAEWAPEWVQAEPREHGNSQKTVNELSRLRPAAQSCLIPRGRSLGHVVGPSTGAGCSAMQPAPAELPPAHSACAASWWTRPFPGDVPGRLGGRMVP